MPGPLCFTILAAALGFFAPPDWAVPEVDLVGVSDTLVARIEAARDEAGKSPQDAEKVGNLGMVYYAAELPTASAACFLRAADLEPDSARWQYYLALSFRDTYETDQAAERFQRVLKIDPRYSPAWIELGDLKVHSDPAAAAEYYQKALEIAPEDARALFGLAQAAEATDNDKKAIETLVKAVEASSHYSEAHSMLARLYDRAGERDKAAAERREATAGGGRPRPLNDLFLMDLLRLSGDARLLAEVAREIARAGDMRKAIATLLEANLKDPKDVEVHFALASLLNIVGEYDQAALHFREVLTAQPFRLPAVLGLGSALTQIGSFREARRIFEEVLSRRPDDVEVHRQFAALLLRSGDPQRALHYLENVKTANPGNPAVLIEMTKAEFCLDRYDNACALYLEAKKLYSDAKGLPERFTYQLLRMLVDQRRGTFDEQSAVRPVTLSKVLKFGEVFNSRKQTAEAKALSEAPQQLVRRAMALASRGAFAQAMRFAQLALHDDDPRLKQRFLEKLRGEAAEDKPALRHFLALCLLDNGEPDAAIALWSDLLGAQPNFVRAYYEWGHLLVKRGKHAEAQALLRRGVEKLPDALELSNALAWSLATAPRAEDRKADEALALALKVSEQLNHQEPEFLDTLAAAYAAGGDFQKAVETEKSAVDLSRKLGNEKAVALFAQRLRLYANEKPYMETPSAPDESPADNGESRSGGRSATTQERASSRP